MKAALILSWPIGDEKAQRTVRRIRERLVADNTPVGFESDGLCVAADSDMVRRVEPDMHIVGDLFSGGGPTRDWQGTTGTSQADFRVWCATLLTRCWGSYIVLRHDGGAPIPLTVFADPIGMRDWVSWRHHGVRIVTCDADRWLGHFPPADLALDLAEIACLVAHPSEAAEARPLSGLTHLEAGAVTSIGPSGIRSDRLWTPRAFVNLHKPQGDPEALAQLVDDCVAAWSASGDKIIMELSGGFDSAMVASSLAQAGRAPLAAFSFYSDQPAGDERRFSRAIAAHLEIPNRELPLIARALDDDRLAASAIGIRPGIGSSTFFHDAPVAAEGQALGARMLFTGRGGDALFFQHPTPWVAADPWLPGQRKSKARVEDLARWCQSSIWTIARHVWTPRLMRDERAPATSPFAAVRAARRPSRWAGPLDGLSVPKRMQIGAIASDRTAFGATLGAQVMQVVHPLLSQPLIEYALGQSIMALTDGRRDRALARAAFATRLPASVVERRGKGSLGPFFGRVLALSADRLRGELLEGTLAGVGLIDRPALEAALDPDHLMQQDCYTDLLALIVIERWMRRWRERLAQRSA